MIISQSMIAEEGYYIEQTGSMIYSIEELAYVCRYQSYALDGDFANKALAMWVRKACGCDELAYRLELVLKEKGTKELFVEHILRFVGYIPEDEIKHIVKEIAQGMGMTGYERKKQEADRLYQQKCYGNSIQMYEELIEILPKREKQLKAACYYNLAAARTQLFLYEQALDALEQSYKLSPEEDTMFAWLTVARMHYPEQQYLDMICDREDLFDLSLTLEERMKDMETQIVKSKEGRELEQLREWMQYGGEDGFYAASGRVIKELCEQYRNYYLSNF